MPKRLNLLIILIVGLLFIISCDPYNDILDKNELNVATNGYGTVEKDIDKLEYEKGEEIQLTATPYGGYVFDHWEGDLQSQSNPATIIMNSSKNVVAIFKESSLASIELSVGDSFIKNGAEPGYDFGEQVISYPLKTVEININNKGTTPLEIFSIDIDSDVFILDTSELSYTITNDNPSSFKLSFDPQTKEKVEANIEIISNAEDNETYTFTVRGEGTGIPSINIYKDTDEIINNDNFKYSVSGFTEVGFESDYIFRIENDGNGPLYINEIAVEGGHIDQFIIDSSMTAERIEVGDSTEFAITFKPTLDGVQGALIRVYSNDLDDNPFEFGFEAVGKGYPDISINIDGEDIYSGEDPGFDFGTYYRGGWQEKRVFNLKNTGASTLVIDRFEYISDERWQFWYYSEEPLGEEPTDLILAPGEETEFYISYRPTPGSPHGVDHVWVEIYSNADTEPFRFSIIGESTSGSKPEIVILQESKDIFSGDIFDFGGVDSGDSSGKFTFKLFNRGSKQRGLLYPLNISNIEIYGTDSDNFTVDITNTETSIGTHEYTTFDVEFNPTGYGLKKAFLRIESNDPNEGQFIINLNGTSVKYPEIEVKANDIVIEEGELGYDFGNIPERRYATVDFEITNTGTGILIINGYTTDSSYFDFQNNSYISLENGETDTLTLKFDPVMIGNYESNITLLTNVIGNEEFEFEVKGSAGSFVDIEVSTDEGIIENNEVNAYDFGAVDLINMIGTKEFIVKNTGSKGLSVLRAEIIGDDEFTIAGLDSSVGLEPGEQTSFIVEFDPENEGLHNSKVVVLYRGYADEGYIGRPPIPSRFNFYISGTGGYEPDIKVLSDGEEINAETDTVNFGDAVVGMENIVTYISIENTGEDTLEISDVQINGEHASQYSVDTYFMNESLEPDESTEFKLTFIPTTGGVKNAQVNILSNDPDESEYTFNISGNAISETDIEITKNGGIIENGSSLAYNFFTVEVGEQSDIEIFNINNKGTAPLNISDIQFISGDTGEFELITDNLDNIVAPGRSTEFGIVFKPIETGIKTIVLSITSDDADDSPFTMIIKGSSPSHIDELTSFPGDEEEVQYWQGLIKDFIGDNDLQWFDDNGDTNGITFNGEARMWVSFFYEEAGYKNRFGYYMYDQAPANEDEITDEEKITVYDNASMEGSGGDLIPGDTKYIGVFNPLTENQDNMAFWMHQDGYRDPSKPYWWSTFDEGTYGEDVTQFNIDSYRHMIMFVDKAQHEPGEKAYVVFGIEDMTNLGDRDFDDLIFVATIEPVNPEDTFEDIVDTEGMITIEGLDDYLSNY